MTTTLIYGDLRTGRILGTIDATDCTWSIEANDAGRITASVPRSAVVTRNPAGQVVERLRATMPAAKSFLAVDIDGTLQQAGPLWTRPWDGDTLQLTATGLWGLFDHRFVLTVLTTIQIVVRTPVQQQGISLTNLSLGGVAKTLVSRAMAHTGGNLPLVYGVGDVAGSDSETFPGWKLLKVGDVLRELTTREVGAPDIRFRPRYQTDRRFIEWVMETGDDDSPQLSQLGDDWYFDANPSKTPVVKITTDEDAQIMATDAYVSGQGSEEDTLIAYSHDHTLVAAGWPRLDIEELRPNETDQVALQGRSDNLIDRSARPIETWTLTVRADAATEVLPFDYARITPDRDDPWLGDDGETYMRVKTKSGDLGDDVTLVMYPVRGSA